MQRVSRRCHDKAVGDLTFIEVFSGSGRLSAEVKRVGLNDATGFDNVISRRLNAPTIKVDLADPQGQALLEEALDDPNLMWIHLAPPSGTASRTRLLQRSRHDPPPTRSVREPHGLSTLTGALHARVRLANTLYQFTARVCLQAFRKGIFCSVENPHRSFFWNTSPWRRLAKFVPLMQVTFDLCMYNGARPKRTLLLHTMPSLQALAQLCDGQHAHLPWGRVRDGWATAPEAAYPWALCRAMAGLFRDQLIALQARVAPAELCDAEAENLHLAQAYTGQQPRGKRIPPLVSEFREILTLVGPRLDQPARKMEQAWSIPATLEASPPYTILPPGSRVIRTQPHAAPGGYEGDADYCKCIVGIPWTHQEFIEKASSAVHPRLLVTGLPTELKAAVEANGQMPAGQIAQQRTETLKRWLKLAVECMEEEKELKQSLAPHCRKILAPKRLKLFSLILQESGHGDKELPSEIARGFDLVGPIPNSDVYRKRKRFATMTRAQLRSVASKSRKATFHSTRSSGDEFLDLALYALTLDELSSGWLQGPYEISDLPSESILTRRFGILQGGKVRPIDDFTASLINLTSSSTEAISLHGVGTIGSLAAFWLEQLHRSRASESLLVKTVDLRKAYKQLCVSEKALDDAFIVVWDPHERKPKIFRSCVLPFGACASVHGFCRTSLAIWKIGVKGLLLPWTAYFDDYVVICRDVLARHTDWVLDTFFKLIGWAVSVDKMEDFSAAAKALGIILDLADCRLGVARISNTEKRRRELHEFITKVLDAGSLSQREGPRLRGRLLFAEAQMFGRRSVKAMGALSQHIHSARTKLSKDCVDALSTLRDRVLNGKPREVWSFSSRVLHMYVDASYEPEAAHPGGLGGVLIDPSTGARRHFSCMMSAAEVARWNATCSKNPIYELEMLAIVVGLLCWGSLLKSCSAIVFSDNEGAVGTCISCKADNCVGSHLVSFLCDLEEELGSSFWYERINTSSNIADIPSRSDAALECLGTTDVVFLDEIWNRTNMAGLKGDREPR